MQPTTSPSPKPIDSLYTSKLISLLKLFSTHEISELQQCLSIPFLKTGKHVDQLLHYLNITDPVFNKGNMSRTAAFFYLFPDQKKYHAQRLNKVMADLLLAAEQYLSIKALKKDHLVNHKLLIQNIQQRLPYQQVRKKIKKAKESLEKNHYRNADFYLESTHLDTALYYHPDFNKFTKEANILMQTINNDLDRFYCLAKLKYSCEQLTRTKTMGEENPIYTLTEIIEYAEHQTDPVFQIYGHMASMLKRDNKEESFKKLRSTFVENRQLIPLDAQANILRIMINQANQWHKDGSKKYLNILLDLYLLGLEEQLLIINKKITDFTFTNATITAAILKKEDLAQQIEEKYQRYLNPAIKKNAVALTRAFRFFHAQKFEEAHQELVGVEFSGIGYKLRARSLLIRCYYEFYSAGNQEFRNAIEVLYKPLQKFIYKNSLLSTDAQKGYRLLFSSILKLTKAGLYNQKKKLHNCSKLRRSINENPIIAKEWLLQKIEELEK